MTIGQNAVATAFDETHTTKQFQLGTRMKGGSGKEYIYVQASGAITGDGYVVSMDENYQAVMVDTDTAATVAEGQAVGVADVAFADNEYGWVQIYGPCGVQTLASAAANVKLSATATAGVVDDGGSTGGNYIDGMVVNTATGGAAALNATAFLSYPKIALIGTYA